MNATQELVLSSAQFPALVQLARYGSYYEILGLGPESGRDEVLRRAAALMAFLDELQSAGAVLPEDEGLRQVRFSISEAARVLSDRRLRTLYGLGLSATDSEGIGV
jgi:hypothetical protein